MPILFGVGRKTYGFWTRHTSIYGRRGIGGHFLTVGNSVGFLLSLLIRRIAFTSIAGANTRWVVFDIDGNFLTSWGEDILKDAHGIFIDDNDNIYCTERDTHVMRKFTTEGELLMTLGTPDEPGAEGEPFNKPTDLAIGPDGEMYLTDGYGNARVHKYSPDGELIKSWGQPGTGPSEFDLPHCVRVDPRNRLMVADRREQSDPILHT